MLWLTNREMFGPKLDFNRSNTRKPVEKKTISHKIALHIPGFCHLSCILCFVTVHSNYNDQHNEKELIRLVAGDDETAFRELFERYSDNIYGVAMAYTKSPDAAEEIVQDVFVKIWMNRNKLLQVERFNDYLFIVARNYILNYLRKHKKDKQFTARLTEYFGEHTITPEDEFLVKESQKLIEQAVAALPPQQQMVYELRRKQDLSLEEIAGQMNISRNTARNHLNQALKQIKEHLRAHSGDALFLACLVQLYL
jgi:RNA polymerase sigma-70 factor (family 1)